MPWTCRCALVNPDEGRFCTRCGDPNPSPMPALPRVIKPPRRSLRGGWMLGAVLGVMLLGCVFGTVMAITVFGARKGGSQSSGRTAESKSRFQQAFEASFKNSCKQSAMRSSGIPSGSADSYCNCALSAFNRSHSLTSAATSCKQYIVR